MAKPQDDGTLMVDTVHNTVMLNKVDQGLAGKPVEQGNNNIYANCLISCGKCCLSCQSVCATCGCGPVQQIMSGSVGLRMELGVFKAILDPGLHSYNPCTEKIITIDLRSKVVDVGLQSLLTKDSVTIMVDAYVNYAVVRPEIAYFKVVDYASMIRFFTQGVMKSIVSEHTLNEMLGNRKGIETKMASLIDAKTEAYGLKVYNIETQRIQLPQQMERAMAIVAETQQQARARVIDAQGNLQSAKIFKQAADELGKNSISLELQYFETLKYIAASRNSTIIVPDSILNSVGRRK